MKRLKWKRWKGLRITLTPSTFKMKSIPETKSDWAQCLASKPRKGISPFGVLFSFYLTEA